MRKKGRIKYFLVFFLCFSIFIYGFIEININKAENVMVISNYSVKLTLNPAYLEIRSNDYKFYVDDKIIVKLKEKYNDIYNYIYNGVFSK